MILRPNYFVGIQVSNPEVHYQYYCFSQVSLLLDAVTVKSPSNIFMGVLDFKMKWKEWKKLTPGN
jgi:hypothetical protein